MSAKIYNPVKNAMQSGKGKAKNWVLEYEAENSETIDPIMGWTSNSDTKRQLKLKFHSCEDAEEYAKRNNITYNIIQPQKPKLIKQTYAENFLSASPL
jgi:hypothetical protein